MPLIPRIRSFIRNLMRRDSVDRDLSAEIAAYIELLAAENVKLGMSPEDARRQARITAGGAEQLHDQVRSARAGAFTETVVRDASYGMRMLLRNPGFTLVAVLTLALGIGANTAIFTVVNGVLLKPLPYPSSEQLYALHASKPNFPTGSISYPNFLDWQARNRSFSAMALSRGAGFNLVINGEPERVRGVWITSDYLPLLGIRPLLGRNFAVGEDKPGGPMLAQISESLWQRKFGGSPDVLGKPITLDGRRFTVIGVVPGSFDLLQANLGVVVDIYAPLGQIPTPALQVRAAGLGLHGIARLRAGVTADQARADMERVTRELAAEYPDVDRGVGATMIALEESVVSGVRSMLLLLLVAVGFVLLIACVNVASLLLARSATRQREFFVRAALGASRSRIVRQLLTETTLLSMAGGALGLVVASWGTRAALGLLPQALPRMHEVGLDTRVLAFTTVISILAGLLFGLAPAFRMASRDLHTALTLGRSAGAQRLGMHRGLVVLEVATTLVLLVSAGLMLRSMARLWNSDPGFNPHNVLLFAVDLPPGADRAPDEQVRALWLAIHSAVNHTPGVAASSLRDGSMPLGGDDELLFWHQGQPKPHSSSEMNWALRYDVNAEYLQAMGIPLLKGRFFSAEENERTPITVVIDDAFANKFFPGQDPIGKRILWEGPSTPAQPSTVIQAEIVGMVRHIKQWGLDSDEHQQLQAQVYQNIRQTPANQQQVNLGVTVRTIDAPRSMIEPLRQSLRHINGELVTYNFRTMDEVIDQSLKARRFTMMLLAAFALTALLLSCVGIYGVISYFVRERTQEIGVRMALGASRSAVLLGVLQEGLRLGLVGLAIGLACALAGTRAMRTLLYGISPVDPLTFSAVAITMLGVALLASFLPAWRATRIDPMQALRCE